MLLESEEEEAIKFCFGHDIMGDKILLLLLRGLLCEFLDEHQN